MEFIFMFLILLAPLAGITAIVLFIIRKASKKDRLSNVWRGRYFFISGFILLFVGIIGVVTFSDTEELASSYQDGRERGNVKATEIKEDSTEAVETSEEELEVTKSDTDKDDIKFSELSLTSHPALIDNVTSFNSDTIVYGDQKIEMIGMDFGVDGVPSILGISDVDGGFLGQFSFEHGFNNDNKKDAVLILYFELNSTKEIGPRSEELAELPKVTVVDNQGDLAKETASVPKESSEAYYKIDTPIIGAIGYAVYSDAEFFVVNIDDQIQYKLENLNFRTE